VRWDQWSEILSRVGAGRGRGGREGVRLVDAAFSSAGGAQTSPGDALQMGCEVDRQPRRGGGSGARERET
jgi:hypothetical protein